MIGKILIPKFLKRTIKIVLWIFGGLIILSISLSLLLLIPSVQKYVVKRATNFLTSKTNMKATVGSIHIGFPKTIKIGDIYLEDLGKDTLLYCQLISINTDLIPLINKNIHIDNLSIEGLNGNVSRNTVDSSFNFSPLLNAFASDNSTEKKSNNWQIGFDEFAFNDIHLSYTSFPDSTSIELALGHLKIEDKESDIIRQEFNLKSIKLGQTSLALKIGDEQKKASNSHESIESLEIPISIELDELDVEDLKFNLQFASGKLELSAILKQALLRPENLDLSTQTITLNEITADEIDVALKIKPGERNDDSPSSSTPVTDKALPDYTFGNFDWNFYVNHAELSNTNYSMDLDEDPRLAEGMDYMHMDFTDFNVVADSLYFNKDNTGATVSTLSIKEISGPEIHDINGTFFMDNQQILARSIELKTAESEVEGSVALSYPALRLIGREIQKFGIETNMKGEINVAEARPFTSMIENNPLLKELGTIKIHQFVTEGVLGNLILKKAEFSMKNSTHLNASGRIRGLPSTDINLAYVIDTLITSKEDLIVMIPDTLLPEGINFPEKIGLKSMGNTDFSSGTIDGDIYTDFGKLNFDAQLDDNTLSSNLTIDNFDVGKMLGDSLFGKLNLHSKIEAKTINNSLDEIYSKTQLQSFEFNQYNYQNGTVSVNWAEAETKFSGLLADSSLMAKLKGSIISLDSANHFNFSLDLDSANLQNLNVTNEFFSVAGKLNLDLDIKSEDEFKGLITANDIDLNKENNKFHIDAIRFESDINKRFTNFKFLSEALDAELTGNTKLAEINEAIIDHLDLYISLPDSMINQKDFEFEFGLDLKKPEIITDFLIEDLNEIKIDKFHIAYNDRDDYLVAEVNIPRINYSNIILDSLNFTIDSKKETATAGLTLQSIAYDSMRIHNLSTDAVFEKDQANWSINVRDLKDSMKYQMITKLIYRDSLYQLSIDPDKTIINYEKWAIPKNNYLRIVDGKFYSSETKMKNGEQIVDLYTSNERVGLNFEKFRLANIINILQIDSMDEMIQGNINGSIGLYDPFRQPTFHGQLDIPELVFMDEYIGKIEANLEQVNALSTKFGVTLQNNDNFIYVSGATSGRENNLSIILESDIQNAATFQPLVSNYIDGLSGKLKGRLSISERSDDLSINGNFNFIDLNTIIKPTNTQLTYNGNIKIEDNLVTINPFTIKDSLNNSLAVTGSIDLRNSNNPLYDLALKTDDFLAINNQAGPDQVIYGKLHLGLDINISGRQSNLAVESQISINKNTDFTYVMPSEDLELIKDEDIVRFTDLENPMAEIAEKSQKQFIADSLAALIKGINLNTMLSVDPKAKFKVLVDPSSGDYTEFQINGKLFYKYNDVQRGVLTGLIELENGLYELSFYGLVKKQFNFDPGSTISWSGGIMDGDINFSARHTVRTNSVGLVSNEISSYERSMYNQRLPYDVILKVKDKISYPTISFEINLPERHRNSYPTLDSKLNILNQPSMESERNKQVFALLVGGTFIPENPDINEGSSSSNFATTAARNSVNAIMTQQLNKLTGQIIQGFDVDLGVNTFDDFSGDNAQTRTQLDVKVSKNLFNDRVSAEMESHIDLEGSNRQAAGQSTAGMTEFAVSYKLTETGKYRIKAFRENAYDIFDGEIQNSGFAFIIIREFDSFRKKNRAPSFKEENKTIDQEK